MFHPAGEAKLPRLGRHELDGCPTERGQGSVDAEVREEDPGRAVAVLLPVEHEAERYALVDADQVRRVATLHVDLVLLDAAANICAGCLLRAEEVDGQGTPDYLGEQRTAGQRCCTLLLGIPS
jgi:hypothetical protein